MKNKKFNLFVYAVVCAISAAFAIVAICRGARYNIVSTILEIISIIVGFIYVYKDATKESGDFYLAFMFLFILSEVVTLTAWALVGLQGTIVRFLMIVVNLVLLAILTFVKDLGKEKTMMIIYTMLAITISVSIIGIIKNPGTFRGGNVENTIIHMVNCLRSDMVVLLLFMAKGKYIDKERRGTK